MTGTEGGTAPTVAITGASTGLGRDMALGFAAKGYRVFGTALTLNQIQSAGLDSEAAAQEIIALAENGATAPRVPLGPDADIELLKLATQSSDAQLDAMRLQLLGLE